MDKNNVKEHCSGSVDPFSEMLHMSGKHIEHKHEDAGEETVAAAEPVAEEFDEQDCAESQVKRFFTPRMPGENQIIDVKKAFKITGIVAGCTLAVIACVFVFLFTFKLGIGVTDDEFIERFNAVTIPEEFQASYPNTGNIFISGTDVLGDEQSPTYTTNEQFCVYAERSMGRIVSVTVALNNYDGYDYATGNFVSEDAQVEYLMLLWRALAGANERFADYDTASALINRIFLNDYLGLHESIDGDLTYTYDFFTDPYLTISPTRKYIAELSESAQESEDTPVSAPQASESDAVVSAS